MEGYCEYITECPVHWRDIMIHVGRGGGYHFSREGMQWSRWGGYYE